MKKKSTKIILSLLISVLINSSCGDSEETIHAAVTDTTNNTTNNSTTIEGDTTKKNELGELINGVVDLGSDILKEKHRNDSIRDANEPRLWVYQIGDSYDDDNLVGQAYDKLKESEKDLYVFRKKHNKYYLLKGYGVSTQAQLNDSLKTLQGRISDRICFLDLSKECKKLPTNTSSVKYKIEREKREAICKKCE